MERQAVSKTVSHGDPGAGGIVTRLFRQTKKLPNEQQY
jgi:hypothetical protein